MKAANPWGAFSFCVVGAMGPGARRQFDATLHLGPGPKGAKARRPLTGLPVSIGAQRCQGDTPPPFGLSCKVGSDPARADARGQLETRAPLWMGLTGVKPRRPP